MKKAIITISDLHVGSTMGLCTDQTIVTDGGSYSPNKFQVTSRKYWIDFWTTFVPEVTRGIKKIILEINGDVLDGVHHNSVNILSNSWAVQENAAIQVLQEIHDLCPKKINEIYFVKGTEVHAGPNGESEERIAKAIGAVPNDTGEYASYQWWLTADDVPFQFAHHIGVTSSAAYESSAPMREMVAALVEASQWGASVPRVIVRSHRHRFIEVPIPSIHGRIRCVITPGWQLRTPFVERIDRMRMPHIGGVVFRVEGEQCQVIEKIYPLPGPQPTAI
jgi:hypothetical protein